MTIRFAKPGEAFFNAIALQLEWTPEQIEEQRQKHFPEEYRKNSQVPYEESNSNDQRLDLE